MEDDIGEGCPAFDVTDIHKAKDLWKLQINRSEAQAWAYKDMQFLVYDDTDDPIPSNAVGVSENENMDVDPSSPGDPRPSSQSSGSPQHEPQSFSDSPEDRDLQRAILESLQDTCHPPRSEDAASPERRLSTSSDTNLDEGDPETDEEELEKAIRMSLMTDEDQSGELADASPRPDRLRDPRFPECEACSNLPVFPHDRKTRRFRVVKLGDAPACVHYVAVSYCWPVPVKDPNGVVVPPVINSQVRDLNGELRCARALDQVLDAAVDLANSCGLRMIWIDQECLPQPQPGDHPSEEEIRYKQLGVQAMDVVYNKAHVTLGLHSYQVASRAQADATSAMERYARNQGQGWRPNDEMLRALLEFLEEVISDRWYTRAWVVQEAISAGRNLIMAFPKGTGIVHPFTYFRREGKGTRRVPRHPLDNRALEHKPEIMMIPVTMFQDIVEAARSLLERRFEPSGQVVLFRPDYAIPLLLAAERLHPKVTTRQHTIDFHIVGRQVYGTRQKVDAATALTLLNRRGCRDVQDRITILANMCDYEIRLNTDEVARCCHSLRLGYLSIALLNGDLSILIPELYQNKIPDPTSVHTTESLLSPFDNNPKRIDHYELENGNMVTPRLIRHTYDFNQRKGLQFPAYGWTVDSMLDFSVIKYLYAEQWDSIKCLQGAIIRLKGESDDEFEARKQVVSDHFSKDDLMEKAKLELFHHGTIPRDSPVLGTLNPDGVLFTSIVNFYRIEGDPVGRKIVTDIVFAILRYLHDLSTPLSVGAANSIWQSLRADAVGRPRGELPNDLPDTVGDELFTHPDVLQHPFKVLQLDKSPDGSFHQAWLIDRIMKQGFIWVGGYRHACNLPEAPPRAIVEPREETTPSQGNLPDTIIRRQFVRRLLATYMVIGNSGEPTESTETRTMNVGNLTYFCELTSRGDMTKEAEQAREEELFAVFDVDGPCIVATPFSHDWEVLPRPSLRSMSVCWVIEPTEKLSPKYGKDQAVLTGEASSHGSTKGKEPEQPSTKGKEPEKRSRKEKEPQQPGEVVEVGVDGESGDEEEPGTRTEEEDTLFRVVDKVKGMWRIMDHPWQLYSFV